MLALFHEIIYRPIYNILVFFYDTLPGQDFGIAIILVTLLLKFIMFPLSRKQIQSQKKMQEIQPKIKALQKKFKDKKEQQTKALLELYRTEKANPFSGCLPLVVQIVILIAIYRVIINISGAHFLVEAGDLYSFVSNPGTISHYFLSIVDLAKPSIVFAVLSATAQYFQTKMLLANKPNQPVKETVSEEPDFSAIMNKQMLYMGPAITLFIGLTFPAALSLYWLTSTLFMLIQQKILFAKTNDEKMETAAL
jgi:YidC/Oxa1 family membrane protein insertase